ncbi:MAG: glycosyltransferase family 9 protein [bacterium]|nr:glycosyltransferase family 9 protein [bacterium]
MKYKEKIKSRLQNEILLIKCLMAYSRRGKSLRPLKKPQKILVVLTGKLGDTVCSTPVIHAIKKHLPNAIITVATTTKVNVDVLSHNSVIGRFIFLPRKTSAQRYRSVVREIAEGSFDVAIMLVPNFVVLALLYLAGIPCIVAPRVVGGFCPHQSRAYLFLLHFVLSKEHRMGHYAPREYLRLLEVLGIYESDTTKHLFYSRDATFWVHEFFAQQNLKTDDFLIGISPSVGNKIKEWPLERFAEVAKYLHENYNARILLLGGVADREKINQMGSMLPKIALIDSSKTNVDELKALIDCLSLYIAVDTGPIYIAEAFGTPTVDIVGPLDENEHPPRGLLHRIVIPARKEPAIHIMNAKVYNTAEARRQVESISVAMVCDEIYKLVPIIRRMGIIGK